MDARRTAAVLAMCAAVMPATSTGIAPQNSFHHGVSTDRSAVQDKARMRAAGQQGPRIVIMVAMEEEAQYLRPYLSHAHDIPMPGVVGDKATRGTIGGMAVDIVISGIGAVWAASATTVALLNGGSGDVQAVISCGCSGAHVPEQRMGDIVLGDEVLPLDPVVISRDGDKRLSGVRWSMTEQATTSWPADRNLLKVAREAAELVCERFESATPPKIQVGRVGSGDAWRQAPDVISEINEKHNTLCVVMEAHAVAQICARFELPFIAIKDIANSELVPADSQLLPEHHLVPDDVKVGHHAALVTYETVRLLAQNFAAREACAA